MYKLWRNAYPLYTENVIKSRGNYDVLYGIVTNFNWSMEGSRIVCSTEITSKDRLYAGISKDMGLTVNDNSDKDAPRPIFQALRDFIGKNDTLLNLKSIAESELSSELKNIVDTPISGSSNSTKRGIQSQNLIWLDILRPIFSEPDPKIRGMKVPYIHGVFSGRPKKFYNDPIGLGQPSTNDFDFSTTVDAKRVWINMGMIVEILNYFSGLDGGKGEPMFQVDIMNSVIGGHPNLISCNRDVLIPNAGAPKFHFGLVGLQKYGLNPDDPNSTKYETQYIEPQEAQTIADKILRRVCYQRQTVCYRNDLDWPINFLRYKFQSSPKGEDGYLGHSNYTNFFAFPSIEDVRLPVSSTGLTYPRGGFVESGTSGLLSNIYISYSAFKETIMDPDPKTASYVDVYKKILGILNNAVDGFWDLILVEVDQIMTITDKNYLPTQSNLGQDDNPTYTFDYFDADSIIRSLRFRPTLTDAQATRAIYGEVNNPKSKYVYVDKNDLLDYKFKDAIVYNRKDRIEGDKNSDMDKRTTAAQQIKDVLENAQKLSTSEDDDSIQMTINRGGVKITGGVAAGEKRITTFMSPTKEIPQGPFEYLKLCLPNSVGKQLFRLLMNDKDFENNPRYCAVQPGITLELTIQGCGGLRTFQYFLVKNLPEPYSHRNIIFRIQDVRHVVSQEGSGWDTIITAGILPLRKYITKRLKEPVGGWAPEVTKSTIPDS